MIHKKEPSLFQSIAPPWLLGGVVLVLVFLGVTTALKQLQLNRVESQIENERLRIVEQAYTAIASDFEATQEALRKIARDIASRQEVLTALERFVQNADPDSEEWLVGFFAGYQLSERDAIEIYTSAPRLVAWNGYRLPLGEAPNAPDFLNRVHAELINDNGVRQVLVIWMPLSIEGRTIGAVRTSRLIAARMPVENQFLQSYSPTDNWRRLTRLPVRVWLNQEVSLARSAQAQGILRPLKTFEDKSLGAVFIPFPEEQELKETFANRYSDIQALGVVMLLLLTVIFVRHATNVFVQQALPAARWTRRLEAFVLLSAVWWSSRFLLLSLDVPARWQRGKAPFAPLFDPSHFASDFGWGLLRSMGDLFITALFGFVFVVWFLRLAAHFRNERGQETDGKANEVLVMGIVSLVTAGILGLKHLLGLIAHHVVIDSSLDYITRTGLLPDRLVFFMFCSMLLVTIAFIGSCVGLAWLGTKYAGRHWPQSRGKKVFWWLVIAVSAAITILYFLTLGELNVQAFFVTVGFLGVGWGISFAISERRTTVSEWAHFRAALLVVGLTTIPLYLLLSNGMDTQLRERMMQAAGSFDTGRDPRVIFALEQVLNSAGQSDEIPATLAAHMAGEVPTSRMDTLAQQLLRRSSLASVGAYDISVTLFDSMEIPVGRHVASDQDLSRRELDEIDADEFLVLKYMFEESGTDSILVEQVTGRLESDQIQYEGLSPIVSRDSLVGVGWVMVRVEPKTLLRDEGTLFPQVLLPTGVNQLHGNLSLAEFQNRVLVRSFGSDFGRYRMPEAALEALKLDQDLWEIDKSGDRKYLTYYHRRRPNTVSVSIDRVTPVSVATITAVRAPLNNLFDHLYYLLRITVAGLVIGVPLYLLLRFGWLRDLFRRETKNRFKGRVLNAFLVVGIFAVGIVGVIGLRVITAENENAIQSWIKLQLKRVDESLTQRARFGELPSETLARVDIDELAAQVGLDLNVYAGDNRLLTSSREQLIRDRLIDLRLPIEAHYALMHEGKRHAFTHERVGAFEYMAGFQVLPDREGHPRFIISVPTLPEQERIEEERARTVAYLFGALLLMMVAVMLTASLLANTLSRPIGRLRQGLEAVAQGRFERPLPVETQDEVGELVRTFNDMQEQLADSRRKLAQQERQLAWREMARQVAHEIKNPLTPMKLSVQHLQRAFDDVGDSGPTADTERWTQFKNVFQRITGTLIEQADALARIANEFSSFARLPKRIVESLDLNAVLDEAVSLMQEQADVEITTVLHPDPLILQADREELRRIYINLIKNAIEATPEDENAQVSVSTSIISNGSADGDWIFSSITDQGIGIPKEMQNRIFEPNFSSKTSGTGLGLAIVKKSIEDLNGEIGFDTAENEGTTFWIRFPMEIG